LETVTTFTNNTRNSFDCFPTCGTEDAERLSGEEGVADAGDGASENRFARAKLITSELAKEGTEGEGGREGGKE
jgi:hypothetical protein